MSYFNEDSDDWGWEKVEVLDGANSPSNRSLHASAVWMDSMYIFGGYDGINRVNDMYEYHFPTKRWSIIPQVGDQPAPRDRHTAVVFHRSFYVFGGFDGVSRINGILSIVIFCRIIHF